VSTWLKFSERTLQISSEVIKSPRWIVTRGFTEAKKLIKNSTTSPWKYKGRYLVLKESLVLEVLGRNRKPLEIQVPVNRTRKKRTAF
jgi:hypothetical protein